MQKNKLFFMVHGSHDCFDWYECILFIHKQKAQKTTPTQPCSTAEFQLTICLEGLCKILVRQSGQGCKVVLCLEGCLLTCYA